jgi:hypothetical protein
MKIGNLPLLWPVLAAIFLRWAKQDSQPTPTSRAPTPDSSPTPGT